MELNSCKTLLIFQKAERLIWLHSKKWTRKQCKWYGINKNFVVLKQITINRAEDLPLNSESIKMYETSLKPKSSRIPTLQRDKEDSSTRKRFGKAAKSR